jgi:hypothetical protein
MQHIQQVLSTLRQHNLYSNLEKCSFGMNIVHEHEVDVDPANIQVICDSPAPTTLTELWSFLGLAIFY